MSAAHWKDVAYQALDPVVNGLARLGITPNFVTLISLLFCIIAAVSIAAGEWGIGLLFLIAGGLCDMADGHLARTSGLATPEGAFLDSFVDRLCDGLLFGGFAMYGAYYSPQLTLWALVALMGALATSYARARAGSLKIDAKVGLIQRPGRMILLGATLFVATIAPSTPWQVVDIVTVGIAVIAISSLATAIYRAAWVMRALHAHE